MDIRLGVSYSTKELQVDVGDDTDPEAVKAGLEEAMTNPDGLFWLTDRRGRQVGVPVAKLTYIEIGSPDGTHRVGFGS